LDIQLSDINNEKWDFVIFLRMMSKKGFYEILNYVDKEKSLQYNQVLKHALDKKIVDSEASVTIILNGLTNLGMLEKTVSSDSPLRTHYSVSKNGHKVINHFRDLESLF
jgi:DNA-binding HxlR family transcriptional regulator